MAQNLELEIKVINRFITRSKRERYCQFVTSAKHRKKFIGDIHRSQFFQEGVLKRVTEVEEEVIQRAMRQFGINNSLCYVISENPTIDTQTLCLNDVLRVVVGWGAGTILVFGNADFIFVELDGLRNRFISKT